MNLLFCLQSRSHGGAECPEFVGWAMAHQKKATQASYDPENPPSAYSNPSVYSRITAYTEVGKQLYGSEWDPTAHPIDAEVAMRAGGGKKHGRLIIGDGTVDTSSCPTLSQIRARDPATAPPIRPRQTVAELQVQRLEVISASLNNYSISNHVLSLHCNSSMETFVGRARRREKAATGGIGATAGGYGQLVCLHCPNAS